LALGIGDEICVVKVNGGSESLSSALRYDEENRVLLFGDAASEPGTTKPLYEVRT
jgi:hypothetical protein